MNKPEKIDLANIDDLELSEVQERPEIIVKGGELHTLATQGEQALRAAGFYIFARGGHLVRPVVQEVDAANGHRTKVVHLKSIDATHLRDRLSRAAVWLKFDGRRNNPVPVPIDPPKEIAETILARDVDEWPFPEIKGVITTPTLRPDGTILDQAGYDAKTRLLLLEPPPMPPIPNNPTKQDALDALGKLESLLVEFPFGEDKAAKAVALSAIITPVVRAAFPVAPMHVARAPVSGSGKSFLFDVVAAVAIGQRMPIMSAGKDETESEKRLGASVLAGQSLITIDNVNGELSGSALCQYIERPAPVAVRKLQTSEQPLMDVTGTTFFATGNNIIIVSDLTRRTITATLDPKEERPELRQFKNNPLREVLSRRGEYIAAALTICRAYAVAGRPNCARRLASFEEWSDTVRSALIWLGVADPVDTMEVARSEDPELNLLRDVLVAWKKDIGVGNHRTAAQVVELDSISGRPLYPSLYAAVDGISKEGRMVDAKKFGNWARGMKGRRVAFDSPVSLTLWLSCKSNPKGGSEWWVDSENKEEPGKSEIM